VAKVFLAVDIAGSTLKAAIVDEAGTMLVRDRVPTPARDVWPSVARLVRRVVAASPEPAAACGVVCSGPIDAASGTVSPLAIPSWQEFPLRDTVAQLTGLPVTLDTDAQALVLAEAWAGAARGMSDVIGVVVGNSVTGGIISAGRLLQGRFGNAGTIGHVVVEPEGRPCACGGVGCLDAYCSRAAIELELGRDMQRAPLAIRERTGTLVGRALASVAALVDVRCAVIGGSVALTFGDPFFAAARDELERRTGLEFTRGFAVHPAALGVHATLIGAAVLAQLERVGAPAAGPGAGGIGAGGLSTALVTGSVEVVHAPAPR
jgi:glucokinase